MVRIRFNLEQFYKDLKIECIKNGKDLTDVCASVNRSKMWLVSKVYKQNELIELNTYNRLNKMLLNFPNFNIKLSDYRLGEDVR